MLNVSCYFYRVPLVFKHLEFQDGSAYLLDTSQHFAPFIQIFNIQYFLICYVLDNVLGTETQRQTNGV